MVDKGKFNVGDKVMFRHNTLGDILEILKKRVLLNGEVEYVIHRPGFATPIVYTNDNDFISCDEFSRKQLEFPVQPGMRVVGLVESWNNHLGHTGTVKKIDFRNEYVEIEWDYYNTSRVPAKEIKVIEK